MKATTATCVFVVLFALVQINARDLQDGKHLSTHTL